ncbi:MAG TPA: amidohydrolase family protein, partial [Casimicrobiaceae bacterium]|nr:amidohydrolase family protein [Casimicrobiaceae bacterium]
SLLAKITQGDAASLPAARALHMATLGGAFALGFECDIGSLEPGKAADLVAIELDAIATLPVYDPVSHLVHAAGREHVSDVWIDGERVVHERQLARSDESSLAARARVWQQRLQ